MGKVGRRSVRYLTCRAHRGAFSSKSGRDKGVGSLGDQVPAGYLTDSEKVADMGVNRGGGMVALVKWVWGQQASSKRNLLGK